MNNAVGIFLIFLAAGVFWNIKNKNLSVLDALILIFVYIFYYFIGFLLHNEWVSAISIHGERMTFSLPGFVLFLVTFLFIRYLLRRKE